MPWVTELTIAALAVIVAVAAFFLTWRSERRSRVVAKTQVYMDLKSRFLTIQETLPAGYENDDWNPDVPAERTSVVRYWHHCFDEWFISHYLARDMVGDLWKEYYADSLGVALGRAKMRAVVLRMTDERAGNGHWKGFRNDLDDIWRRSHAPRPKECPGIKCEDTASHRHTVVAVGGLVAAREH